MSDPIEEVQAPESGAVEVEQQDAPVSEAQPVDREPSGAEEQGAEEPQTQETQGQDAADEPTGGEQESGPSPDLAERAARLGVGEEDLQALGENAGMVLDKIERLSDAHLSEIGRKLAGKEDGEQAPEPPAPDARKDPEPDDGDFDVDEVVKGLQEAGYDEPVVGAFKRMATRLAQLEQLGDQWSQAQEAQRAEAQQSRQAADQKAYSDWVGGLASEQKALLADPKTSADFRNAVKALNLGNYAVTGEYLDMAELCQRAFRQVAGDQLLAQARNAGKQELVSEAKQRANGHLQAPASQVKRNTGPATVDEAISAIGDALEAHGFVDPDPRAQVAQAINTANQ